MYAQHALPASIPLSIVMNFIAIISTQVLSIAHLLNLALYVYTSRAKVNSLNIQTLI